MKSWNGSSALVASRKVVDFVGEESPTAWPGAVGVPPAVDDGANVRCSSCASAWPIHSSRVDEDVNIHRKLSKHASWMKALVAKVKVKGKGKIALPQRNERNNGTIMTKNVHKRTSPRQARSIRKRRTALLKVAFLSTSTTRQHEVPSASRQLCLLTASKRVIMSGGKAGSGVGASPKRVRMPSVKPKREMSLSFCVLFNASK
mmetsp:Transcript_12641/g.34703  ORF Transcript_12641/g.34703 Transcript_12641/m.34703 type:complete len:203 (-) Transcript_12641:342-950(-)